MTELLNTHAADIGSGIDWGFIDRRIELLICEDPLHLTASLEDVIKSFVSTDIMRTANLA
jgi:hypothetical protein